MSRLPGTPDLVGDIREVQIELTEFCDADCGFCINRASFAKERRSHHGLPTGKVEEILAWIAATGIERVRFTGGEPLLRRDLIRLLDFANREGLVTGVNTNGHFPERLAEVAPLADFILLSFVSANPERTDAIFRRRGSHELKLRSLSAAAAHPNLWVSTVLQRSNVAELLSIGELLANFGVGKWILLRPEANGRADADSDFGAREVEQLVAIAARLQQLGIEIGLGNAVPICAGREPSEERILAELLRSADGGLVSEGRSKLVIDPSGRVLCHYGLDIALGEALEDMGALWRHPVAEAMRDTDSLPAECLSCEHLDICLGGSRIAAHAAEGSYRARDPLMRRPRTS
jgi:radical SAM protein with 4Fe4S-binding SPASM domain